MAGPLPILDCAFITHAPVLRQQYGVALVNLEARGSIGASCCWSTFYCSADECSFTFLCLYVIDDLQSGFFCAISIHEIEADVSPSRQLRW